MRHRLMEKVILNVLMGNLETFFSHPMGIKERGLEKQTKENLSSSEEIRSELIKYKIIKEENYTELKSLTRLLNNFGVTGKPGRTKKAN